MKCKPLFSKGANQNYDFLYIFFVEAASYLNSQWSKSVLCASSDSNPAFFGKLSGTRYALISITS